MNTLSIRSKLLIGFICVVLLIGFQVFIEYWRSLYVEKLLGEAYRSSADEIAAASAMTEASLAMRACLPMDKSQPAGFAEESMKKELARFQNALAAATQATGTSQSSNRSLGAKERTEDESKELSLLIQVNMKLRELQNDWALFSASTPASPTAAELPAQMRELANGLLSASLSYQKQSLADLKTEGAQAAAMIRQSRLLQALAAAAALLCAVAAGLLLSRAVVRPIRHMVEVAHAISSGDSARRIAFRREDEFGLLGDAFDGMLDALDTATIKREELEAIAAERTEELNRFFTFSLDMLCIADFSGKFLRVNHAFEQALGYTAEELTSRPFRDFIHPDDVASTEAEMEKYRTTGAPTIRFENRYRHKDGSWRILSWNAVPLPQARKIYAAARDITELRQIELALKKSEKQERRQVEQTLRFQQSLLGLRDEEFDSLGGFVQTATKECARQLGLARASIWFLTPGGGEILCEDLYQSAENSHTAGMRLSQKEYPSYFQAISSLQPLAAHDVLTHPSTRELIEGYLRPLGIASMLDLPIRMGGRLAGVLCCEHTAPREWTTEEIGFASGVATAVMLAVEKHERSLAEKKLRDLNATLESRIQKRSSELTASEERFRLMIEQVQDYAIFLLDPHGIVVSWNLGAERTKGYTAAEIVGRHYSCFYTPEDQADRLPERLLQEAVTAGHVRNEGWRVRKDGSRFWTEVTLTAIRDPSGELRGFAKVTRDLTERRAADLAQQEALETQRELTRKALAGEKAKSEFLAIMSHEVRTPMNGIIGYADLLADSGELTGANREYAEILLHSGQALLRILDDILDFSGLEAGSLKIENEVFDVRAVIEEVKLLVLPAATRKGLAIALRIAPETPSHLIGDPGRLRQVLLNLAGNAVKFTATGAVTLGLEPAPGRAAGAWWDFSVSDTGPGLSAAQQENIFDPFVQADTSSSRRHGGTGLGLAISKRLAELMGGALSLESAPGQGSRFTARLPMQAAPEPAAKTAPAPSSPADHDGFARLHPLRILVAEDDAINRKLMLTMLQKLGYEPAAAANGREAVEAAARERPDCILMDLQMPEMDGFEATAAIRQSEAASADGAPIYICALTANTDETDRRRCFTAGMSAHVNKPIRKERLCAMLAEASRAAARHEGGGSHAG